MIQGQVAENVMTARFPEVEYLRAIFCGDIGQ